ncbi:DUF4194 domain-containing protein [Scandinavium sp. H11S7]|uniref:DUF4194 domain-containing protein n=1 Tax=Scandinavium hiltneri TaxID=2926519 RepID=UPI002165ED41|nr:DUF4194 domain-containing protein [Scandinavium hiltneri]MCS2157695.1 DUF4194 domain-containing protein [Scandinavium hiltneri]
MELNSTAQAEESDLPVILITLLKGVIYKENDPHLWGKLLRLQIQVREYFRVLFLELHLDEAEGYVFLRSQPVENEADTIPRLISRRPLSFPVSLLLALLRKKLAEFDASNGDTRLILTLEQIVDLMRVFLAGSSNEARQVDNIARHINKVAEMGFLRPLRGQDQTWEVRRILKAFVDAQWLADFDNRLQAYHQYLQGDHDD